MTAASSIHLRRGRVIDPAGGVDAELDVVIEGGRIARIGKGLATPTGAEVIDAAGWLVVPGLVDLHTHLREPGQEYKETIASGAAAAAAGGFTTICAMPNTVPPNDNASVTEFIGKRATEANSVRVRCVGAVSKGLAGEVLSDMGDLAAAGVVAFSDDGRPVMNARLMRRAMEYGRTLGLPIVQHAEDLDLSDGGVMTEGRFSTRAGLRGQPAAAESVMVARDIALCELTGGRYHVAHVSTAASVRLVRDAKQRGLPVTCEVTPHHLTLTDEACVGYDTATKVNPPLRDASDVEAVREALADGTIDAVATDHAPHSTLEKAVEFDSAAFGMVGFETAVPLVLALVRAGRIGLPAAIERLTAGPARAFTLRDAGGLAQGGLPQGALADVCCIDAERTWKVVPESLRSKSHNTPFAGREMVGRAVLTLVGGRIVHDGRKDGR